MPSPFPGMNPFLEQERVWHDFHKRFIPTAAEMLDTSPPQPPLPPEDAVWAADIAATARKTSATPFTAQPGSSRTSTDPICTILLKISDNMVWHRHLAADGKRVSPEPSGRCWKS